MVVQERSTMLSMFVTSTVHFEEVRSPSLEICGYLVVDHASNQGSYRGFPLFMNKVAGSYGMYFEYRLYNERNKVFSCTWAGVKLKITDHIVQCRRGYGQHVKDTMAYKGSGGLFDEGLVICFEMLGVPTVGFMLACGSNGVQKFLFFAIITCQTVKMANDLDEVHPRII
ncbi:hypothetical protein V6N13_138218 [Hibiscus sabdariffa]